ncbi:MAG: tRNA (adenosine(37)-N6)-threonylcarbamoyltransferase complex transferase subunit TsaD [Pseudomonadota bacterium]
MDKSLTFLGIETSCDETAASVVRWDPALPHGPGEIISNIVASQIEDHAPFGGVVPEIAARAHLDQINPVIAAAMDEAGQKFEDLDGMAVTAGPGLAGGLIVGTMAAKAIAAVHGKPLHTVNHLEGHALTPRLTHGAAFPYLLLLVSGGHTQILLVRGVGDYERWATTIDDALGEAFDKTAKMLGLPYPGGPQVERTALRGNPKAHAFPRPLGGRETLDMSFSGLKTAVRKATLETDEVHAPDICASFQQAVGDVLVGRLGRALQRFAAEFETSPTLVVAGGVAANKNLRARLEAVAHDHKARWIAPPLNLCTDNGAMIAWAGAERMAAGLRAETETGIRPRWPLDPNAGAPRNTGNHGPAHRAFGAGRKGAKA